MEPDKMRIVYKPLLISTGGKVLSILNINGVQFLLDPLKYNPAGVVEAADYSNPKDLTVIMGQQADQEALIDLTLGSKAGQMYRENILPLIGTPEGQERIAAFLDMAKKGAQQRPEDFLLTIDRYRKGAARMDKSLMSSIAYAEPHVARGLLMQRADSGYADDAKFVKDSEDARNTLQRVLKKLPEYLCKNLEKEPVTIALMSYVPANVETQRAYGKSISGANLILLDKSILKDTEKAATILREETVHYLDEKIGFTRQPEFQAATARLLANEQRMLLLEQRLQTIHKEGKIALSQYSQDYKAPELLAEYVHVKESLHNETPRYLRMLRQEKRIQRELDAIFGPEVHALGEQFEAQLQALAKSRQRIEID